MAFSGFFYFLLLFFFLQFFFLKYRIRILIKGKNVLILQFNNFNHVDVSSIYVIGELEAKFIEF